MVNIVKFSSFEFSHDYDEVEEICKMIRNQTSYRPTIGVICGTGLSALGDMVEEKDVIPYEKIPQFPRSTGNVLPKLCMNRMITKYFILFNYFN